MSVIKDGKGIAFSSLPWFQIGCGFFLLLIVIVVLVPITLFDVEKGRFAEATHWFYNRQQKLDPPVLKYFFVNEIHEGKNGWTATLTRKPGEKGCHRKYGCYSVTFDSAKREPTCSNTLCTDKLLP